MRSLVIFAFVLAVFLTVTDEVSAEPDVTSVVISPNAVDNQIDEDVSFQGDCSICQDDAELSYFYWNSSIDGILKESHTLAELNFDKVSSDFTKGDHEITLQVQDNNGDWSTIDSESTATLAVDGKDDNTGGSITVNFEIVPPLINLGQTAKFAACREMMEAQPCVDDPNPNLSFDWDIMVEGESEWTDLGSAEVFEASNFVVGEHDIRLTITDNSNDETANDVTIFIVNPPLPIAIIDDAGAAFVLKEEQILNLTSNCFDYQMVEIICNYEWELRTAGNMLISTFTVQNISLDDLKNSIKDYIIKLRTKDADGTYSNWVQAMIIVNEINKAPNAFITISPDSLGGMTPKYYQFTNITFDSSASTDADGDIRFYEWRYNGTVVSTDSTWVISFDEIGFKNVKLLVIDNDGLASSTTTTNIDIIENTPPLVSITVEFVNGKYQFNSTANDSEGHIITGAWHFEYLNSSGNLSSIIFNLDFDEDTKYFNMTWDGKKEGLAVALTPGISYKVKYIVKDDGGLETVTIKYVEIPHSKIFVALVSPKTIEVGESIKIDFTGTKGPVDFYRISVNYPDGTIKKYETSNNNYSIEFSAAGEYALDIEVFWTDGIPQDGLDDWYGPTIIVGGGNSNLDEDKEETDLPSSGDLSSISIIVTLLITSLIAIVSRRQR